MDFGDKAFFKKVLRVKTSASFILIKNSIIELQSLPRLSFKKKRAGLGLGSVVESLSAMHEVLH
jgi:hypothetical protein